MATLRLFIAIDTPPDIKAQIAELQNRLKECNADVRWEPEEKLHATLKFLGSTDEAKVASIISSLEQIAGRHNEFTVRYHSLDTFPSGRDPRVIWVGMDDVDSALMSLQSEMEAAMEQLGYERESRRFHPHLTLGRVKGKRNLKSLLTRMESLTFQSQPVTIREVLLVKSDLQPTGSVYTTLKSVPFKS